jgi:hypothetical protein
MPGGSSRRRVTPPRPAQARAGGGAIATVSADALERMRRADSMLTALIELRE